MGVSKTQTVRYIRKGEKGEPGAVLRGPQAWSDCATGYAFQAGKVGDAWQDVVLYNGNYYVCKVSHAKTNSNYPTSTTAVNNNLWQLGDSIDLVATKILMATYALVKNLGVEAIDMKDSNGNVLFQAKDGNVTCKTGTFENVTVNGNIKVKQMQYRANETYGGAVDCAFISGGGSYVLPVVPSGEYLQITVFNPTLTRTYYPTILTAKDSNGRFLKAGGNYFNDTVNRLELTGFYRFTGCNLFGSSLWIYEEICNY